MTIQMESLNSVKNEIDNIIGQVQETTVDIGHSTGHFISHSQVESIQASLSKLVSEQDLLEFSSSLSDRLSSVVLTPSGSAAPSQPVEDPDVEEELSARLSVSLAERRIQKLRVEIAKSDKDARPKLNEALGREISRRAKANKVLATITREYGRDD